MSLNIFLSNFPLFSFLLIWLVYLSAGNTDKIVPLRYTGKSIKELLRSDWSSLGIRLPWQWRQFLHFSGLNKFLLFSALIKQNQSPGEELTSTRSAISVIQSFHWWQI